MTDVGHEATGEVRHGLPVLQFSNPSSWEAWLDTHHAGDGVWLKFAKKDTGVTTVTYAEALESALCYGWIDGQTARLDDTFYLQRFTPRRPRSRWSQINREKVSALIGAGRMKPAGLAQVEAAQADGRWDAAYPPASRAEVPDDLAAALDGDPRARQFFASLTGSRRYAFLHRLHAVKGAQARSRRIGAYIEMLRDGRTPVD